MLSALSPLDGRYESKIQSLKPFFSEQALIKYRVFVEIKYFLQLCETVPQLSDVNEKNKADISKIVENFSEKDVEIIKKNRENDKS